MHSAAASSSLRQKATTADTLGRGIGSQEVANLLNSSRTPASTVCDPMPRLGREHSTRATIVASHSSSLEKPLVARPVHASGAYWGSAGSRCRHVAAGYAEHDFQAMEKLLTQARVGEPHVDASMFAGVLKETRTRLKRALNILQYTCVAGFELLHQSDPAGKTWRSTCAKSPSRPDCGRGPAAAAALPCRWPRAHCS
jgi:hypothetical protein